MNELVGHLIGVIVTLLMLSFIGIWVWAWLPRHKHTFARLAEIPMEDPLHGAHSSTTQAATTGLEETTR